MLPTKMTPETDAASGAESRRPARQRVSRNAIYNLVGETVPILAALLAIPVLIRSLGTDRFGLLTIVWMVIGYFGLFDFGLGRALTKIVAEKLGAGRPDDVPALTSSRCPTCCDRKRSARSSCSPCRFPS
jgi:hypothetical protein